MLRRALSFFYNNYRARFAKWFRTKEIVKALNAKHLQELSITPVNLWPKLKQQQSDEITAARDGRYPIVDRRTFAYPTLPESLHRLHQPIMKASPYNLRRFSETPIPRRAINLIKNSVLSLRWRLVVGK